MSLNSPDSYLDIHDANLRIGGDVEAQAIKLAQIEIISNATTTSTVQFNNATKSFDAASNIEVGTANLFVDTTTSKVGIGTTSPDATLHVTGNAYVSSNLEADYFVGDGIYMPGTDTTISSYVISASNIVDWATRITGSEYDNTYGMSTDSNGNIYIVGRYWSALTLYNADTTAFSTTLSNSGSGDAFIAKYNTSGAVQWAARIAGTGNDSTSSISTDNNGNIYVTGTYTSSTLTLYNANGSVFNTTLSSSSGYGGYVAKYNTSGTVQWAARIDGPLANNQFMSGISVDSSGNVYVCGYFTGSSFSFYVQFYNADTTFYGSLPGFNASDSFVVKYNTSGVVQWTTRVTGSGNDLMYSISVDSSGDVYVSGSHSSSVLTFYNEDTTAFSTTLSRTEFSTDTFLAKYNTSGVVQWVTKIAGAGSETPRSISTDNNGNIYVVGTYDSSTLTLYNADTTAFSTTLPNLGSNDGFIAKYDTSGVVQWGARVSGTSNVYMEGTFVNSSGDIYVVGQYNSSTLTLYNADGSAFGTTLPNLGSYDGFIAKYNTSGVVQWATRVAGTSDDIAKNISVDNDGNIYVSGTSDSFTLTLYNSDGTVVGKTLSNSGINNDVYIAKYIFHDTAKYTKIDSYNSLVIKTNVGIGTTSPDATLHVTGNAYVSSNLEVGTANLFVDTVNSRVGIGTTSPDATLHVTGNAYVSSNLEVGTANLFVDTVSGRVGVGTIDPNEKLDVYGTGMRIHDPAAFPKIDLLRGGSSRNPNTDTFGASNYVDWRITSGPQLKFQQQYTGANLGNLLDVMTLHHSSGNVEIPGYLKTGNPVFYAYKSSGSVAQDTVIIYQSTRVNKGSHYNTSNGIFTCPVAGIYTFTWGAIGNSIDTIYRYRFRVNNSNLGDTHLRLDTTASGTNYGDGERTVTLSLNANDNVRIHYKPDNASTADHGWEYTYFQGHLISYN